MINSFGPTPATEARSSEDLAETLAALQRVIENSAKKVFQLKAERKVLNERQKNILENDEEYRNRKDEAEKYNRSVKERKAELQAQDETVEIKMKRKEIGEEIKEVEESLSNHLINYRALTGSNLFETSDGRTTHFVAIAKFKPEQLTLFDEV